MNNPYIKCIKKYAAFQGRARRTEFWGFTLINAAVLLILLLLHAKFEVGAVHTVITYIMAAYSIFIILPSLAVSSRRWHDLNRTGWWLLLNLIPGAGTFVSLCFFLCRGSEGKNFYGSNPRKNKHERK